MNKRKKAERHSFVRSEERFDIGLTQNEQQEIIKKIKDIRHKMIQRDIDIVVLKKQSDTRTLYAVFYGERWLPVVYSVRFDCLITVLPEIVLSNFNFVPPRYSTPEEQKEAFLACKKIPAII
jgi:hypothetical protein